jgi:crossover junction endodeoxyribonuclease RuvC
MLYDMLNKKVDEFKPEMIVIERIFFNTNTKTAIAVGQARGVLLLIAAQKKLKVHEYTALQAKLVVSGYGRSKKKEMQEAVRVYFDLEKIIKPDDASDAVAMALCHIHKEIIKDDRNSKKN